MYADALACARVDLVRVRSVTTTPLSILCTLLALKEVARLPGVALGRRCHVCASSSHAHGPLDCLRDSLCVGDSIL